MPRKVDAAVWLPFPPSTNNLFPHTVIKGKVRRFPSKVYARWKKEAGILLRAARIPQFDQPVVITIRLIPANGVRRDVSNYIKAIEDALVEARILQDDNQKFVHGIAAYWDNPSSRSGAEVTLRLAERAAERVVLTAAERRELARIEKSGLRLVGPNYRPSVAINGLVQKGRIMPLPGIFGDDQPQGYKPV